MLTALAPAHQALSHANDDRQVIGMKEQIDNLAKRLKESAEGERHLKVFSIVGYGGVGKTTLAMEVCRLLEAEFPYQAFVSLSQAFEPSRDLKPLLKRLLEQIAKTKSAKDMGIREEDTLGDISCLDSDELAKKLEERLKDKRYLIVMDDAWTIRGWEAIQSRLPENNCNSRVIVTTRMETVAKVCCSANIGGDSIYHMQPLELEKSKRLFLSRVFGSANVTCPAEHEQVMDKILKKCGGLPLAIISIASILVGYNSFGSIDKWKMICRSLGSEMESNPTLEGMKQIVTLSFNHLPHELKNCMMYLSIFPEDYLIKKERLLQRWIAEGLVSQKRGLTLREVAESYLDELLCRNMIETDSTDPGKSEPSYRVHDMILEVMVSKSLEANFVSLQGGSYHEQPYARIRRLSVHGSVNSLGSAAKRKAGEFINIQHVRSLSIFQPQGHKLLDQLGKFMLLRVLDLQDCEGVTNQHVKYACQLQLLKFLSLEGTNISVLPSQVGNLEHLQMLNVSYTLLNDLPVAVTKLARLEELRFSNKKVRHTMWKLPRGINKMKKLRSMGMACLRNDVQVAREVGELEQLQEIHIDFGFETICEEVLQEITQSLSKRYSLQELYVSCSSKENKTLNFLHNLPSPPRLLRTLGIAGEMDGLPSWIGSLTYLVEFSMYVEELGGDRIFSLLCDLPNLKKMRVGWMFYNNGDEMVIRRSYKFPMLRYMSFGCIVPKIIRFEEGSTEKLENFELKFRDEEADITIIGIESLTSLKKVTLVGGKDYPALKLVQEQLKVANDRRPKSNQFQVAVKYI